MWFVYILRCSNGSLYVGETRDVVHRVLDHNRGRGGAHTSKHRPVEMVYVEQYSNRDDAYKREQQLKSWTRAKKEALIAGNTAELKKL
jgi:putative endonuclease